MLIESDKCKSCGGKLSYLNSETMQCEHCKKLYYISLDRTKRIGIRVHVATLVRLGLVLLGVLMLCGMYYFCFGKGREVLEQRQDENEFQEEFSDVFREFTSKALNIDADKLKESDLDCFQYLNVDYANNYYIFRYSFEDYYDYRTMQDFESHIDEIRVLRYDKSVYLTDVRFFKKLTRLEARASTWCDYTLADDNVIRSIICEGNPYFREEFENFTMTNPDTLEEFQMLSCRGLCTLKGADKMKHLKTLRMSTYCQYEFLHLEDAQSVENLFIEDTGNIKDFSPIEKLPNVKQLYLEEVESNDITFILNSKSLEAIRIDRCSFDAASVQRILELPSLKAFIVPSSGFTDVSKEEQEELKERYPDKFCIID